MLGIVGREADEDGDGSIGALARERRADGRKWNGGDDRRRRRRLLQRRLAVCILQPKESKEAKGTPSGA
eukprot:jgi/Psemu1/47157/gm1.47157_g